MVVVVGHVVVIGGAVRALSLGLGRLLGRLSLGRLLRRLSLGRLLRRLSLGRLLRALGTLVRLG